MHEGRGGREITPGEDRELEQVEQPLMALVSDDELLNRLLHHA